MVWAEVLVHPARQGRRNAFIDRGDQFVNITLVAGPGQRRIPKAAISGSSLTIVRRILELAKAAGARLVEGPFLDFLDPWGNRLEIIEYASIQFTKAPNVLRGMGLGLDKGEKAKNELAEKGMAEEPAR